MITDIILQLQKRGTLVIRIQQLFINIWRLRCPSVGYLIYRIQGLYLDDGDVEPVGFVERPELDFETIYRTHRLNPEADEHDVFTADQLAAKATAPALQVAQSMLNTC